MDKPYFLKEAIYTLQEAINTFEELKKYVFVIDRGSKESIVLKFTNGNFYHLMGFQHTNINLFIPTGIISKAAKFKYIKKNVSKFENILQSEIKENERLKYRVTTFCNILDLLKSEKTTLYNLNPKTRGSLYDGDFGLMKLYETICCLLGLKIDIEDETTLYCVPQSWMASTRTNILVENKRPIYMREITKIPIEIYNQTNNCIEV